MRSATGTMLMRLFVAMSFLLASQSATAGGCGETLDAAQLGTIAQALSRANQSLMMDVSANDSRPMGRAGTAAGAPGQSERIYRVLIPAMQLQETVDRLSVLAQLRDLMRDPQDRLVVQGAIASFAAKAGDVTATSLTKLAQDVPVAGTSRVSADISHVRGQAARASKLLARCKWKGH